MADVRFNPFLRLSWLPDYSQSYSSNQFSNVTAHVFKFTLITLTTS